MELLTCDLGGTALAILSEQIARVGGWDASPAAARLSLAQALGLSEDAPCARELICQAPFGEVAFGIPSSVVQRQAAPGSIVAPSRILKRLGAPGWLAGFFLDSGGPALIVDLALLSLAARPPQETT